MTSQQEDQLYRDAIAACRMLVAAGFLAAPVGDPNDLHMLLFVRDHVDVTDAVKVYGPAECEAARIVNHHIDTQAEGTTPEGVRAVVGWPSVLARSA